MGTRAVISFYDKDEQKTFCHVYQHGDGYPEGVWDTLNLAKPFAWEWPRYEAMDFAAAFIRGNKEERGGGIYITKGPKYHWDLAYSYAVSPGPKELMVACYAHKFRRVKGEVQAIKIQTPLFTGTLTEFGEWATRKDEPAIPSEPAPIASGVPFDGRRS